MKRSWHVVIILAGCAACGRSNNPSSDAPAQTAPALPAATAVASVVAMKPAAPSTTLAAQEQALFDLARRWNVALASRRADDLAAVYGSNVNLYGKTYTRADAVTQKRSALAKAPDYTQSIGPVAIDWQHRDRPRALFEKKWTQAGKTNAVVASLTFGNEGSRWLVVEESDAKADRYKTGAQAGAQTCEGLVTELVLSTPEAKAIEKSIKHFGTRTYTEENPHAVALHEDLPDHLATMGWFLVDVKTGKVIEGMPGDDMSKGKALAASPALAARVVSVCAKTP